MERYTYDTGGYSLKPREGMVGMKGDMGGATAVLGAMEIIGELRPEQNAIAVILPTDNVVSGTAFKPDDVITFYERKTIEVLNTDAEGRVFELKIFHCHEFLRIVQNRQKTFQQIQRRKSCRN